MLRRDNDFYCRYFESFNGVHDLGISDHEQAYLAPTEIKRLMLEHFAKWGSFADALTYWRFLTKVRLREFSEMTGLPTTTLHRYESGQRQPSLKGLSLIARSTHGSLDLFSRKMFCLDYENNNYFLRPQKVKGRGLDDIVRIRLQTFRKLIGVTQVEISKKLGITQAQYSNYESGRCKIRLDVLLRVCDVLQIPPYLLLGQIFDKNGELL